MAASSTAGARTPSWPDFGIYGFKLRASRLPSGASILVAEPTDAGDVDVYGAQLGALRFRRSASGIWFHEGGAVQRREVLEYFPNVIFRPTPMSEIAYRSGRSRGAGGHKPAAEVYVENAVSQADFLGLNHMGHEVYEGVDGRFFRERDPAGASRAVREQSSFSPPLFLRANTDAELELCAEGLALEAGAGRVLRMEDMRRFANAVFGGRPDDADPRYRVAQEFVVSAMVRRMELDWSGATRGAFERAVLLHDCHPPFFSPADNYVPLPLAVVTQRVLAGGPFVLRDRIFVANHSSSLLVNDLSGAMLVADSGADVPVRRIVPLDGQMADCSVGVYARGLGQRSVVGGLDTSRSDWQSVMHALGVRKPEGRSLFCLRGTAREARPLFAALSRQYEVEGVVELDRGFYAKSGTEGDGLLFVVGPRVERPTPLPEVVPVIRDFDRLWDWGETLVAARSLSGDEYVALPPDYFLRSVEDEFAASVLQENSLQSPYVPASRLSEAATMIPRNLVGPTREALAKVMERHGDIDEFVAGRLGWSVDEMRVARYLSAEQTDAVALAIDRVERGLGFVEADSTGVGKGRVLAALARYAKLGGMPVMFFTEKENLFTDFYRDVEDIGSLDLFSKPLVLNTDAVIRAQDGRKLFSGSDRDTVKSVIESGCLPDRFDILLATYSQFARDAQTWPKAAWLAAASRGAMMLLDESHKAAGESYTNVNFFEALKGAGGRIYSSATFAKEAANMAIYRWVFPDSVNVSALSDVLAAGGEPLYEVLSAQLAEDGAMVRREHDNSKVEYETRVDWERMARNEELSDKFAAIVSSMVALAGTVRGILEEKNNAVNQKVRALAKMAKKSGHRSSTEAVAQAKKERYRLEGMGIGSILYSLKNQFNAALLLDMQCESAIADLDNGRKPVVYVHNTMEALLRGVQDEALSALEAGGGHAVATRRDGALLIDREITFRDAMRRMVEGMYAIRHVGEDGREVRRTIEDPIVREGVAEILLLIEAFPDMPISPIDAIHQRVREAGFTTGEITGRKLGLQGEPGRSEIVTIFPPERNKVVMAFNGGEVDAVVMSGAGSTGLSLHASARFANQNQRALYQYDPAPDIAQQRQADGRVNRTGQVCYPRIISMATGLPGQARRIAMDNAKQRKLSANTTSNRDSMALADDAVDILNRVGNAVVKQFLEDNPEYAGMIGLEPDDFDPEVRKRVDPVFFANRLMAYIDVFPVATQRQILDDVDGAMRDKIMELESIGQNPFKSKEYDWKATVVSREVFEGLAEDVGDMSVLDRAVFVSEVEFEVDVDPIRRAKLREMIAAGMAKLVEDSRVSAVVAERFDDIVRRIEDIRPRLLEAALSSRYASVGDALADQERPNAVKGVYRRLDFLVSALNKLDVGAYLRMYLNHEPVVARIVRIELPRPGAEHQIGGYRIKVVAPGDSKSVDVALTQLRQQSIMLGFDPFAVSIDRKRESDDLYDAAPGGKQVVRRTLLDGNLFRAAQIAHQNGAGTGIVYTDNAGVRQRGMLMPKGLSPDLVKQRTAVRIINADVAMKIFESPGRGYVSLRSNPLGMGFDHEAAVRDLAGSAMGEELVNTALSRNRFSPSRDVEISLVRDMKNQSAPPRYTLSVPASSGYGAQFYGNQRIVDIVGAFSFHGRSGSRRDEYASAQCPPERIRDLLKALSEANLALYADPSFRPLVETEFEAARRSCVAGRKRRASRAAVS